MRKGKPPPPQRNRTDYYAATARGGTIIRKENSTASGRIGNQNSMRLFFVENKEIETHVSDKKMDEELQKFGSAKIQERDAYAGIVNGR